MKRIALFLIPYSLFLISSSSAQESVKDSSISMYMFSPTFAYQLPGGDMAKTFGNNLSVGGSFAYKTKSNWIIAVDGNFIFGTNVRDTAIFDSISTNQGFIIGTGGTYSSYYVYERGYQFNIKVGKIIPKWGPNPNSGILLTLAGGFLQHKLRIEVPDNDAPQISGQYKAGYDLRTNGLSITELIGYQYLSNRNLLNFFAGFEFIQAFTKNRRTYNYNIMAPDNSNHFDTLNGIRAGWILTLYKRKPRDVYYN